MADKTVKGKLLFKPDYFMAVDQLQCHQLIEKASFEFSRFNTKLFRVLGEKLGHPLLWRIPLKNGVDRSEYASQNSFQFQIS